MLEKTLKVIHEAADTSTPYNAQQFPAGYHTLHTADGIYPGKRDCQERVRSLEIDFTNKVVLDVGCNQGGMLFAICQVAKFCYGIDANHRLINACQKLRQIWDVQNLNFFTMDVVREPLACVDLLVEHDIDVCFLQAMCEWLENWRDVMRFCSDIAPVLVLETNGLPENQREQEAFAKSLYKDVTMVSKASFDDPYEHRRKCFVCSR